LSTQKWPGAGILSQIALVAPTIAKTCCAGMRLKLALGDEKVGSARFYE